MARMEVGDEWWTPSWLPKDIDPIKPPAIVISGHGIDLDGYNALAYAPKNGGHIGNSWSTAWDIGGYGDFVFEDYAPHLTEAWAVTLNPIPVDNSPTISSQIVILFLAILRKIGLIV